MSKFVENKNLEYAGNSRLFRQNMIEFSKILGGIYDNSESKEKKSGNRRGTIF